MMSGVQATVPSLATTASPATITSTKNNNNRNRNKKKAILYGFWRILFATVALLDLTSCWSTIILSGGGGAVGAGGAGLGRSGVERNLKEGVTKRQQRRKTDTVVYNNQINEEDETPVVEDNTCEKNDERSSISADDDDDDDDDTFNEASFLQQHQNVNGGKNETTSEIISEDSYYYYYYYYDYYDYYSTRIIESITVLWSSFSNKLVGGVGGEGNNNSALSNELNSFNGTCINKKSVSKKKKIKKNNNKKKRQEQQQQSSTSSSSSYLFSPLFSIMIHLLLGLLCLIEMIIRSIEAKRIVFEHEAINLFEEKFAETIARVYSRRKLVLQGHRHNRLRQKHNIKFNLAGGGVSGFFMNATTKSNTAITRMIKTQRTSFKLNPYLPSFSSSSTDTTTTTATMTATTATPSMAVLESSDDDQQKLLLLLLEEENKDTDHAHHDIVNAIASNVDNDHAIPNDDDEHDHDDHDHDEHEYVNVNVEDDDEGFEEEEEEDEEQKVVDADVNKEDNEEDEAKNKRNIILFLRSTFRLYLPVGITCIFWISLLPFKDYYKHIMMFQNRNDPTIIMTNSIGGCINSDEDTALATIWITTFIKNWNETIIEIHDIIVSTAWEQIIWQYNAIFQPKLFWKRVQNVLNVVKWIRFAFPLFRMILKLNDQIMLISSTYRSMKSSDKQRERRIRRPSLMLRDLRRIESFHKVETTLASWPSQCSMLLDMAKETLGGGGDRGGGGGDGDGDDVSNNNNIAEQFLEKSRIRGKQITKTIKKLQRQLRRSVTEFTSSEVYDNIVRLSRDISCRHIIVDEDDVDNDNDHNPHEDDHPDNSNTRSSSNSPRSRRRHHHRSSDNSTSWYDYLHLGSLLGSRDYLISPRSRFSVMVRITVTNCLVRSL